jgi:hypothetical protein
MRGVCMRRWRGCSWSRGCGNWGEAHTRRHQGTKGWAQRKVGWLQWGCLAERWRVDFGGEWG